MHSLEYKLAGKPLEEASKVLIMVHGRGGDATDILGIAGYLQVKDFALLAPVATNNTWYPFSFMSPTQANEPWLSSAIDVLGAIVNKLVEKGFNKKQIYFLGFSQGACLILEFVARNATKYGGVIAFTGGVIGEKINRKNYSGDFENTSVFIGSSDPDPHVPVSRVNETVSILRDMNANVTVKIYKGMGHTISQEEIVEANKLIL